MDQSKKTNTYLVSYEVWQTASLRKLNIIFNTEKPISSGEEFNAMASQVARTAVSNGQASSVDDVAITNVSLLNDGSYVNETFGVVDSDEALIDDSISPEYVTNLEAAYVELADYCKRVIFQDGEQTLTVENEGLATLLDKQMLIYNISRNKQY